MADHSCKAKYISEQVVNDLPGRAVAPYFGSTIDPDHAAGAFLLELQSEHKYGSRPLPKRQMMLAGSLTLGMIKGAITSPPLGVSFSLRRDNRVPRPYPRRPYGAQILKTVAKSFDCSSYAKFTKGRSWAEGGRGWQSTLKMNPEYAFALIDQGVLEATVPTCLDQFCPTVLRDRRTGRAMGFQLEGKLGRSWDRVSSFNTFLSCFKFGLNRGAPSELRKWISNRSIEPYRYCRIFGFDRGGLVSGRLYDCSFQNLKKHTRNFIEIDGRPTVEIDVAASQPSIIAGLNGERVPSDIYERIADCCDSVVGRDLVKLIVTIGLGAREQRSGREAILSRLHRVGQANDGTVLLADVLNALEQVSPSLFHALFRDSGARLQLIEGDIQEEVAVRMTEEGIPGILIHDGVRIPFSAKARMIEIYHQEFERRIGVSLCPGSIR